MKRFFYKKGLMQHFGTPNRNWNAMEKEKCMMQRSRFNIMTRLVGLVKPLTGHMVLAVMMGVLGHLCASFITVFGGYAVCPSCAVCLKSFNMARAKNV